ncbi:sialic acid-binding Ig-like lectin 15 [Acipenser oxyrinchus oxyrinchus]|uniref:Sialic acid-binding Ig-like lectin 15 n=1 Tax=Acipenser oxyrinchus oxyrinchus TaxID=40147 RepID=A0AAD8GDG5_ACIOX|nr:sialic acid-binding Ig-like lectin 15 [Acipenser oxyrinchus oxyrinchus]
MNALFILLYTHFVGCLADDISLAKLTGSHADSWSMNVPSEVTVLVGHSVVLPCTFTHPYRHHHGTILVTWRLGRTFNGTVVFQCSSHNSSDGCEPLLNQGHRYQLVGNPRAHDLSLRLDNVTFQDANKYFCCVELSGPLGAKFENKMGIQLLVAAPAQIVDLSVLGGGAAGYSALCRAEGEPLPSISWTGPHGDRLRLEEAGPSQLTLRQHQTTRELQNLSQDGRYTCMASNAYGSDRAAVYLVHHTHGGGSSALLLMWISLGAKLVIFLLLLGALVWLQIRDNTKHEGSIRLQQSSSYENI